MNLFTLFAKLGLDTSEYDKNVDKATKKGKDLGNTLGTKLASAAKIGAQARQVQGLRRWVSNTMRR